MPNRKRRRRRLERRAAKRARSTGQPFLRRRSTKWLVAAIITLTVGIVLGVIADQTGGDDEGEPPVATPTLAVELPDLQPDTEMLQPAEVARVIDGDTIEVRIDGRTETVRYYGIDTPERGDDCYDEATERNESLVAEAVLLMPDARERDRYERLLRYVFDEDGQSVEARLIAEGLGVAWQEDGAYRDELVALEEETRTAGVGCLWER